MKNFENENVKELISRIKEIQKHSDVKIPAWMLDEERYGNGLLTAQEQQEWAETVVHSMRGTVALLFLISCEKRWGLRNGNYQFKAGEFTFALNRELIENLLIQHVESTLLESKNERYIAVYQFYSANYQLTKDSGKDWFEEFLNDIFADLARRLRSDESASENQLLH